MCHQILKERVRSCSKPLPPLILYRFVIIIYSRCLELDYPCGLMLNRH